MTYDPLEFAVDLIKAGDVDSGGKILINLLKENQKLEQAWVWLFACVRTDEQRVYCIKQVLILNPSHERAKAALEKLTNPQNLQLSNRSESNLNFFNFNDQFNRKNSQSLTRIQPAKNLSQGISAQTNNQNQEHRPKAEDEEDSSPLLTQAKYTKNLAQSIPAQTTDQNQEPEQIAKIQEETPLSERPAKTDKDHTSSSTKFKVAFVKPKIITNKSDDNPYAKTDYLNSDFPDINSMMYGNTLFIGGIRINDHDYPRCVSAGHALHKSQCYICEFFSVFDCPIRKDATILHEAKILFSQNKRYRQENEELREAKIAAIYSELKDHGRPLHYEVIARIMKDRHPNLRLSATMILHFMGWHPEKFEWVESGVFRAK